MLKTLLKITINIMLTSVIGLVLYKYELAKAELVFSWMIYFYGFSVIAPFAMRADQRPKKDHKKQFICNVIPMGVVLLVLIFFWIKTEDQLISKALYLIITLCCVVYSIHSWVRFKKSQTEIKTKALDD